MSVSESDESESEVRGWSPQESGLGTFSSVFAVIVTMLAASGDPPFNGDYNTKINTVFLPLLAPAPPRRAAIKS